MGRGGNCLVLLFARLSICLSIRPSIHATQFQSGANAAALKLKDRQTDRQTDATCTLSSSPPPSSHIWLGFFLVCFCHSLGFFGLVWVYFWYPLKKKKKKCDA